MEGRVLHKCVGLKKGSAADSSLSPIINFQGGKQLLQMRASGGGLL